MASLTNLTIVRGLKKLAYGRYLQVSRFRKRLGLTPAPTASGPLTEESDWSYPDGTPGQMNNGQTKRYQRDQEFGQVMLEFGEQLKVIEKMREEKRKKPQGIQPN